MVVCTMQTFTTNQQLADCSAMKFTQATNQVRERKPEILNNGNGAEDDREEGEIVDDFEMIISSEDEEFKLRARIQQLEDKSNDIEKMNMLSANLANQYSYQKPQAKDRFTQHQHFSPISVLSDVSSLSDQDLDVAKKYRKHKVKRNDSRKLGHIYRRNPFANRTHIQHGRRKRRHNNQFGHQMQMQQVHQQPSTILLDTLDIVTEDEIYEYDRNVETENDEHEDQLKLSRNKLRVALARTGNSDVKPKHSLRERLQCRIRKSPSPKRNQSNNQINSQDKLRPNHIEIHSHYRCVKEERDEQQQQQPQMSQIEDPQELKLRLIALKSAILKKHLARQKRDAERAYSPTDMINRVHQPTNNTECDDIDDLMEISPAASPERNTYSPPEVRSTDPVDMELAQTDSDEDKQQTWQSTMATGGGSWRCFMQPSYPPESIPIVIDDEEELQQDEPKYKELYEVDDEGPPPPPPSFRIQHMQLEDDDARDASHLSDRNSQGCCDIQSVSMDNSRTHTQSSPPLPHESSDDEAGALRAVLLSKRKAASDQQVKKSVLSTAVQSDTVAHDSDDPEQLRQLLLSSIATKKRNIPERREILKKAVRRFQSSTLQSTEDNSLDSTERGLPLEPDQQNDETFQPLVSAPHSESEPACLPLPVPEHVPEPAPALQPKADVARVPAPMKPSSTPLARIIKIVKPNKVINKKTALKRKASKIVGQTTAPKRPSTLLVKEPVAPLHSQNSTSTTRLITALDPASIKVNKLVIALADSSAGSDDELELRTSYNGYPNYTDNASPFSQAMDSASSSTTRSNTPNSEIVESANMNLRRTLINDHFEKKLDDFLKQARSKVATVAPTVVAPSAEVTNPMPNTVKPTEQQPKVKEPPPVNTPRVMATPVAVRHLPVASQREYLRLIERMQQLEKKRIGLAKSATNGQATAAAKSCPVEKTNNSLPAKTKAAATVANNLGAKPTTAKGLADATATSSAGNTPSTSTPAAIVQQASKESRLKAFESSFLKIGDSMIANLDKSLRMVDEAKRSKIERLRHTQRLKDLYAEMQIVKQAVKKEELKLARIQPEIQASHEIIISLKQKRIRLRNAAMDLGNGLHGADYRLLDPAKAEITRKSVELTKEIRLYNSIMKYDDMCDPEAPNKAAEGAAAKPVPEPQPADNREPAERTFNCSNTIQSEEAQPVLDEKQSLQAKKCSSSSIEPGNDVASVGRQPDIDAVPQNVAIDDADSSGLVRDDGEKPPPYTTSIMRELREEPEKPSLLGEYRTPMCRNYNSQLNVNATMCPFELMGRCEDTDCSYLHLTRSVRPEVAVPSASTSKASEKTIQ